MENLKEIIERRVFDFFVKSNDFNGISLWELSGELELEIGETVDLVKELVAENKVSIQSSTNPHIIGFRHFDVKSQLYVLEQAKTIEVKTIKFFDVEISMPDTEFPICLYPSPQLLKSTRDIEEIRGAPYTLELALAEPHLKPVFFEIEVLDRYFNDPRYNFDWEDYSGSISCHYDVDGNPIVREEDQVFIKTFGLGFDPNDKRLAVVYLRYLNDLTKEHQVYWKSKESKLQGQVVKEYIENTIHGNWSSSHSIFSAFLGELKAVNELSNAIFAICLFRNAFEKEERPKEFTFFFTPTLKNYNEFVLLMDKMLSENINKKFFEGVVDFFVFEEVEKGVVERKSKGTLQLFEEWLTNNYKFVDQQAIKDIFNPLREIRKERQSPAHRINENVFDEKFTEMQKILIGKAYSSLRAIRMIFQKHPNAKDVKIPKWLDNEEVKMF